MGKNKTSQKYTVNSYGLKMTKRNVRTKFQGHIRKDLTNARFLVITITLFDSVFF